MEDQILSQTQAILRVGEEAPLRTWQLEWQHGHAKVTNTLQERPPQSLHGPSLFSLHSCDTVSVSAGWVLVVKLFCRYIGG